MKTVINALKSATQRRGMYSGGAILGIIGRREFEHFVRLCDEDLSNVALIAALDPDDEFTMNCIPHNDEVVKRFGSVLQIAFWDIAGDDVGRYKGITPEQGKTIASFIAANQDKQFIVHCAAGVSRSAGIAKAIECIVEHGGSRFDYALAGSEIDRHPRYTPNMRVFDSVMDGFEGLAF
ncbi:hypothetical protein D6833_07755 [Candidatus Parcubacteria bacterium]|nr:MAG: hypothetical protein D6833_07755 [Candidatus Parcubacteria bacterium]